jgi:hypothetical protein
MAVGRTEEEKQPTPDWCRTDWDETRESLKDKR